MAALGGVHSAGYLRWAAGSGNPCSPATDGTDLPETTPYFSMSCCLQSVGAGAGPWAGLAGSYCVVGESAAAVRGTGLGPWHYASDNHRALGVTEDCFRMSGSMVPDWHDRS